MSGNIYKICFDNLYSVVSNTIRTKNSEGGRYSDKDTRTLYTMLRGVFFVDGAQ